MLRHVNEPNATAVAQLNLIHVYEERGKLKDALALCKKNIELWKATSFREKRELLVDAKAMRARLLLRSGREMDAEEELDDVVRMSPTVERREEEVLRDVEMTLGMFHTERKRLTEAIKPYKRALHIVRQEVYRLGKVHQEFATMWLEKGDHERFKSHAEKAIELLRKVGAEHRVRQLERLLSRVQVDKAMTLAPMKAEIGR